MFFCLFGFFVNKMLFIIRGLRIKINKSGMSIK
jgi:hypothetical protein